jgi:serine/threonine protein kinase
VPGYRLTEPLGRGGYGEVWKAVGPGNFPLAIKIVPLTAQAGPVELRALDAMREVRHPHLLSTIGAWQKDNVLLIAMELADRTLLERFQEAVSQGHPGIPAHELIQHFEDASEGIDFLNESCHALEGRDTLGIQHRDIKPQNLLLVGGRVKVADFGLARVLTHTVTGHTGSLTPAYAAPEFFNGKTFRQSDQYSLAVTYCHLRGGRLPYTGTPAQIMAGHLLRPPDLTMLPPEDQSIVARALAKDPKNRWPNCRAFVEALRLCRPLVAFVPDTAEQLPTSSSASEICYLAPANSELWHNSPVTGVQEAVRQRIAVPASTCHSSSWLRLLLAMVGILVAGLVLWRFWYSPEQLAAPLQVQKLRVSVMEESSKQYVTYDLGMDKFVARFGDLVQVKTEFSEPVYCFLLAFNTDGKEQLCWPPDEWRPPQRQNRLDYPQKELFALNDGVGLQAFVVLASRHPLPAYDDWKRQRPMPVWRALPAKAGVVWRGDGKVLSPVSHAGDQRGKVVTLPEQTLLDQLCEQLLHAPGIEALAVKAFVVSPADGDR